MFKPFVLILLLIVSATSTHAEIIKVPSLPSLQLAINNARPGDNIVVIKGVYTTTAPVAISVKGTKENPVKIEAEAAGGVEINGTNGFVITDGAEYIIIEGFVFRNNTGTCSISPGATHCVVMGNVFECAPVNNGTKPYLNISGDDNEVCYNTFQNKMDEGQMVSVQGPGGDRMAKRAWIHHNYFYNFPPKANNCSAIQIGLSGRSMDSSFCVIEYNLFIKTAGENEGAICAKACRNIIRFNTFGEGSEELSLRHGNRSEVYGNFFIGSTGLRFSGDDHKIYANYFKGCHDAIVCTNGDGEVAEGSKLTCHDRPDRVDISYNAMVDCKNNYRQPERKNGLGSTNITFRNNIMTGGAPVSISGSYLNGVWKQNIVWKTTAGDIPDGGFTIADPHLSETDFRINPYGNIPANNRPIAIENVGQPSKREAFEIKSPGGKLSFTLNISDFSVSIAASLDGHQVLKPSPLKMIVDSVDITNGASVLDSLRIRNNERYPVYGLHSVAIDNYNGITIEMIHKKSGLKYTIESKIFDNAFAYRFVIPGDPSTERYPDEKSVFNLPQKSIAWYHDLYMHYEGVHIKKDLDTVPSGQWAAPPVTIKLADNKGYLSITEANLVGYPGMALQTSGNNGFTVRLGHSHPASYPYVLRYSKEDVERLSHIAPVKGTITTPWRVVITGQTLNDIVTADAISNLCPPPDKKLFPKGIYTEWIKPGRAVWRYLDGGGDNTLSNMKEFSRQAAALGFEYNILEGFWRRWPEDSVRSLVDYSRKLGVGIIVWKHSKELREKEARLAFFDELKSLGISGIKIDFFDNEAKEVIDLYESIIRESAERKLVLIFHGANKPTGLSRTYPNILIYEGVKGMEASKLTDRATHETTLPFTRMIAGPADYSVCHFGTRRQNTTWVHQIATAAIFSAPVITYAANPGNLLANPGSEIIKSIPAVWDETIVLPPSEIGELVIFAQRKDKTWFLSVINGTASKSLQIPLSFLGKGNYESLVLSDNPAKPDSININKGVSTANDIIKLELGPGGGFIGKFSLNNRTLLKH